MKHERNCRGGDPLCICIVLYYLKLYLKWKYTNEIIFAVCTLLAYLETKSKIQKASKGLRYLKKIDLHF